MGSLKKRVVMKRVAPGEPDFFRWKLGLGWLTGFMLSGEGRVLYIYRT